MSKLEELIKELCPDGVEYKTLGELGKFYSGLSGKTKDDFTDGNEKFITYMNVFSNISIKVDVKDFVKISKGEKQNTIQYGDVIFTGSSETPNECGISSVLTIKTCEKLYLNSFCFGFRFFDSEIYNPDFSKYMFRSINLRKQIVKTASGVTRFNVSKKKMEKVRIPILPLAIQQEIVRILENLTDVTEKIKTKLQEEIKARKKQYEYYKNDLLTFGEEVEWRKLGECIFKASNIKWSENKEKEFRYIDLSSVNRENGQIYETQNITIDNAPSRAQQIIFENDVIFGTTRPMLKRYCLIPEKYNNQICSTGFCILRANANIVLPKWIFYLISTENYYIYVEKYQKGASYPAITDKEIKSYRIPIPSLEEQQRIVDILDSFDTSCADIIAGILCEIEARQKQYEYYRDKLLSFKELKKEGV